MTEVLNLGPPEYAALATLFTGLLIALNWAWIDSMRPKTRFHLLIPEIDRVMEKIDTDGEAPTTSLVKSKEFVLLLSKLDDLGITIYPNDLNAAVATLPMLGAMAETKDLKSARTLRFGKKGYYFID